jgi:hypothetical protein
VSQETCRAHFPAHRRHYRQGFGVANEADTLRTLAQETGAPTQNVKDDIVE